MSKSVKIKLKKSIDFNEHIKLCRLCLNKFEKKKKKIKITDNIEIQYYKLTHFNLNKSTKYSKFICEKCHQFLNEFTILQDDWIFKQTQLEKFVGDLPFEQVVVKSERICEPDVSITESHYSYQPIDNSNQPAKPQIKIEIHEQISNNEEIKPDNGDLDIPDDFDDYQDHPLHNDSDDDYNPIDYSELSQHTKNNETSNEQPEKERPQSKKSKYLADLASRPFHCEYCTRSFKEERTYRNHQANQHPEKLTKEEILEIRKKERLASTKICQDCGRPYTKKSLHRIYFHTEKVISFFCDQCEYSTHRKMNLIAHVKKHAKDFGFVCRICGRKYNRRSVLNDHMKKHSDKVSIECPQCGQKFKVMNDYYSHKKYHKMKPFNCKFPECYKMFSTEAFLESHEKWHFLEKNFKCHYEGCDKSYANQTSLRNHVAVIHQNYRKKCLVKDCTYETGIRNNMRSHMKTHRELKPEIREKYISAIRSLNLM